MFLTPRGLASLTRWFKVTAFGVLAMVAGSLITFATNNGLDLTPTIQTFDLAIVVPLLAAFEKWASWQTTQ